MVALDDSELVAKRNSALAQLATAEAQFRSAGVKHDRELWSPQSESSPGGMGIPNLFDQMFTQPMESFSGRPSAGVERRADLYSSGIQIHQARNAIMSAHSQIEAIDAKIRDARVLPLDG